MIDILAVVFAKYTVKGYIFLSVQFTTIYKIYLLDWYLTTAHEYLISNQQLTFLTASDNKMAHVRAGINCTLNNQQVKYLVLSVNTAVRIIF